MPADPADWRSPDGDVTRRLIAFRHSHPALRRGDFRTLLTFNGVLAYRRRLDHDDVVVVLNPRDAQRDIRLPLLDATAETWRDHLAGGSHRADAAGLVIDDLPATSALVLTPEPGAR